MRGVLLAPLLALVALSAGLAGCIEGKFFPAEIPSSALAAGWSLDSGSSEGGEQGLEPIVKARYQVNVYQDRADFPGLAIVISVSEVPLYDVQGEIQKQLDAKLREFDISLTPTGSGSGTIGPDAVTYQLFDAQGSFGAGGVGKGKAIDIPYTCSANGMSVRVFGLATTEATDALIGTARSERTWTELTGGNPASSLDGMLARVRCSA